MAADPRVKIINQAHNLGEIRNMNFLLEIAQGGWLVWRADDDLMHPEFLMMTNQAILDNRERNIVGFFSNYSSATSPLGIFPSDLTIGKCSSYSVSSFITEYSLRNIPLIGCYGLMRVDALTRLGGVNLLGDSFGPYSDTLIPILLAKYGDILYKDQALVFLRTHEESISSSSTDFSAYVKAEHDFLARLKTVCADEHVNVDSDKIVANMLRWFSDNEWAVLARSSSLSNTSTLAIFIGDQLRVNLPRLTWTLA